MNWVAIELCRCGKWQKARSTERRDLMNERFEMGANECIQFQTQLSMDYYREKMTSWPPDGKCRAFCWTEWTVQRLIRQLSLSFSCTDSNFVLLVIISVAFKISSAVFCIHSVNILLIICFLFYFSGKFFIRSDYIQLDWDPSSWAHEQNSIRSKVFGMLRDYVTLHSPHFNGMGRRRRERLLLITSQEDRNSHDGRTRQLIKPIIITYTGIHSSGLLRFSALCARFA